MPNKLIQDLTSGNILVTDLLEHQPIAGAPSLKGTVTQLFSTGAGSLVINRDSRLLVDAAAVTAANWASRLLQAADASISVNWTSRLLVDAAGSTSQDWANRTLKDSVGADSINYESRIATDSSGGALDYENRQLLDTTGNTVLEWFNPLGVTFPEGILGFGTLAIHTEDRLLLDSSGETAFAWENRELIDSSGAIATNFEDRQLIGPDGTTVILDWNTITPIDTTQRVFDTPTDPNGVVTATKPAMCYGDDGSLWVKTTAGPDNTGWTALITA